MNCDVCGGIIKRKNDKSFCSSGCRYKKNVVIWVLKFMDKNGTFSWEKIKEWYQPVVGLKLIEPEIPVAKPAPPPRKFSETEIKEIIKILK